MQVTSQALKKEGKGWKTWDDNQKTCMSYVNVNPEFV